MAVFFFMIAAYFRHGIAALIRVCLIVIPVIALIIAMQGTLVELPYAVQRTLSFLPGKWERSVVDNARGSTEWRLQIWERVCDPHNKYIVNWWYGDGFGMTKAQLVEAYQPGADLQENFMVSGDYHSLPLSAVHTVGFVGTFFLIVLMLSMAFYSWKLIEKARNTPYFAFALFVGVPIIISPALGFLVFGAYKGQIVDCIFGVAMLRLVSRSLAKYQADTNIQPIGKVFPQVELNRFPQRALQ